MRGGAVRPPLDAARRRARIPHECPIGGRTLHITARHEFRDAMGKVLPPDGPGLTAHAASVRDVDVTWEWK